jgi:hypothetical protein
MDKPFWCDECEVYFDPDEPTVGAFADMNAALEDLDKQLDSCIQTLNDLRDTMLEIVKAVR